MRVFALLSVILLLSVAFSVVESTDCDWYGWNHHSSGIVSYIIFPIELFQSIFMNASKHPYDRSLICIEMHRLEMLFLVQIERRQILGPPTLHVQVLVQE
jgi:hypothetical protein